MTNRFAVPLFVKSRAGADRKMHVTPRPLVLRFLSRQGDSRLLKLQWLLLHEYCGSPRVRHPSPMPPRSTSRLSNSLSRGLQPYICPSCRHGTSYQLLASYATARLSVNPSSQLPKTRPISTVAPVSAVDVHSYVPDRYKALYKALENLGEEAKDYVDPNTLKFCMRYLQKNNPKMRVAGRAVSQPFCVC